MVRLSPERHAWSHKVCRASNIALAYRSSVTAREVDWKSINCPESLVLQDWVRVRVRVTLAPTLSLAFVVHSMNSMKDQRLSLR